jgi:hypothetical protein
LTLVPAISILQQVSLNDSSAAWWGSLYLDGELPMLCCLIAFGLRWSLLVAALPFAAAIARSGCLLASPCAFHVRALLSPCSDLRARWFVCLAEYGEEDLNLKRGKPLRLNAARVAQLQQLYLAVSATFLLFLCCAFCLGLPFCALAAFCFLVLALLRPSVCGRFALVTAYASRDY